MNIVRTLFTRTNILARRFSLCSTSVKLLLFRSFCICFYGTGILWCRPFRIQPFMLSPRIFYEQKFWLV